MQQLISRFLSDQSGATAIEYCLIASGIALAIRYRPSTQQPIHFGQ
jgi:Flp pilus assembly pilin Flp